jgi:hypothetical protein
MVFRLGRLQAHSAILWAALWTTHVTRVEKFGMFYLERQIGFAFSL